MNELFNDILSALFGKKWLAFFLIAVFIFLVGGVWIASTPEYETMYNYSTLPRVRTENAVVDCHIIEVGNTGRKVQDSIDIAFFTDAYDTVVLKPKARNYGKVDRRVETRRSGDTTVMRLDKVEPGMRVEVQLVFIYKTDRTPYDRDEILKGIEATEGDVVQGDPGWTTVGRMLYGIFG